MIYLSTCNRVEFYTTAKDHFQDTRELWLGLLKEFGLTEEEYYRGYHLEGKSAVRHLLRVAMKTGHVLNLAAFRRGAILGVRRWGAALLCPRILVDSHVISSFIGQLVKHRHRPVGWFANPVPPLASMAPNSGYTEQHAAQPDARIIDEVLQRIEKENAHLAAQHHQQEDDRTEALDLAQLPGPAYGQDVDQEVEAIQRRQRHQEVENGQQDINLDDRYQ